MAALGELERSVMDLLWDHQEALTANAVRDLLALDEDSKGLAVTTVLTVLARLEKKGLVNRERGARPHLYHPTASREEHTVGLIEDALGTAEDREAVLVRFAGAISAGDAAALLRVLAAREDRDTALPAGA
ncbi:transcriptional regulator [Galactobacter valiniphilus]|uniref:Transcriptional regulator n=1 Tax=Galactobacter valiniphilus TaxID=2676122 RepID=A0A399JBT1_9MICC|nr:BlaI/MecI/CopY family transcriptional regulator [Galactobacter valiniphilus]RII42998.1 transcriptional regulator [Galactobacter valiniphilus]